MGWKYEVKYLNGLGVQDLYTNNWFEFIKTRIAKKVIYYKVYK